MAMPLDKWQCSWIGTSSSRISALHQPLGGNGRQNTRHVLDAEGVDADLHLLAGILHEFFHRMDRRNGIAERSLHMAAVFLDRRNRRLDVARIVQRIEDPEDVDAVFAGKRHEAVDHVIGIVPVADKVLAAQEHLERGVFRPRLDGPQPLPGVFAQEAQADIEGGAAPALQRVIADIVDHVDDAEDILGPHAGGPQRLVRIAQGGIGNAKRYLVQLVFGAAVFLHGFPILAAIVGLNLFAFFLFLFFLAVFFTLSLCHFSFVHFVSYLLKLYYCAFLPF